MLIFSRKAPVVAVAITLCGLWPLDTEAGMSPQGMSPQGMSPQGMSPQGMSPQGMSPQGMSPQGMSPQGMSPQGMSPQGMSPQGMSPQSVGAQNIALYGRDLPNSGAQAFSIDHIEIRGTSSLDTRSNTAYLTGNPNMSIDSGNYIMVGTESAVGRYAVAKMADANGVLIPDPTSCVTPPCANPSDLELYIADAAVDSIPNEFHSPDQQDNQDMLYVVYTFNQGSGLWASMCPYEPKTHMASASAIADDPVLHRDRFFFACTANGVAAKCARNWGYRPWATTTAITFNKDENAWVQQNVDLHAYYDACVVAARAAYCQDDQSFTKTGTIIDLFDTQQVIWPNAIENPFNVAIDNSRWMLAQEYFISTEPRPVNPLLPASPLTSTPPLRSALQRTRYRELSPQGQCNEFAYIDRLEHDHLEDGRWATTSDAKDLHIFSPFSCKHNEQEVGVALPWDCTPCTTQVCAIMPSCCGANGGTWDASCTAETKKHPACHDDAGVPTPGLVWPRDIPAGTTAGRSKYLIGAGGSVVRVDGVGKDATISGWACDPEWPGRMVTVRAWAGGPREQSDAKLVDEVTADEQLAAPLSREVAGACDGPGTTAFHGFTLKLTNWDGGNIYLYAIDEATADGPAAPPTLLRNGLVHVPTCDHPETVAGTALPAACSTCAKNVCGTETFDTCCTGQWDATCAQEASAICKPGESSAPANAQAFTALASGWIQATVDGSYSFQATEQESRLWINGKLVIDWGNWARGSELPDPTNPPNPANPNTKQGQINLMGGTSYSFLWLRRQTQPPAPNAPLLLWLPPGGGGFPRPIPTQNLYQVAPNGGSVTGLQASYTRGGGIGSVLPECQGANSATRIDPVVDFDPEAPPSAPVLTMPSGMCAPFSATWHGEIVPPADDDYTFVIASGSEGTPSLSIDGQAYALNAGDAAIAGAPPSATALCPHTECQVGARLDASCGSCAAAVCQLDGYCCNGGDETYYTIEPTWDARCVAEVKLACPTESACTPPTGPVVERKTLQIPLKAGVHYHIDITAPPDHTPSPDPAVPPKPTFRLLWQTSSMLKQAVPTWALRPENPVVLPSGSGLNVTYFPAKDFTTDLDTPLAGGLMTDLSTSPAVDQLGTPLVNMFPQPGDPTTAILPPPSVDAPPYGDEVPIRDPMIPPEFQVQGRGTPGMTVSISLDPQLLPLNPHIANGLPAVPPPVEVVVTANGTFSATMGLPPVYGSWILRLHQYDPNGPIVNGARVLGQEQAWLINGVKPTIPVGAIQIDTPRDPTFSPLAANNTFAVSGKGAPNEAVVVTDLNPIETSLTVSPASIVAGPDGSFSGTITLSAAMPDMPSAGWHKILFRQQTAVSSAVFISVGIQPPIVTFPRTGAELGTILDCTPLPGGNTGQPPPHDGWQGDINGTTTYSVDQLGSVYVAEETGGRLTLSVRRPVMGVDISPVTCTVPTLGMDGLYHYAFPLSPEDLGPGKHVIYVFQAPDPPLNATPVEVEAYFRGFASVANATKLVLNVAPPRFMIDGVAEANPICMEQNCVSSALPNVEINSIHDNNGTMFVVGCGSGGVRSPMCAAPNADVSIQVGSGVYRTRADANGGWTVNHLKAFVPGWTQLAFTQVLDSSTGGAWSTSCPTPPVLFGSGTANLVFTKPADFSVAATSPAGAVVTYADVTAHFSYSPFTPVPVTCAPASGDTFPIGVNHVLCSAPGDNGPGTATFDVTVTDGGPTILFPPELAIGADGNTDVEATDALGTMLTFQVTATDVEDGPNLPVTCTPSSPHLFSLGSTTTLTCTATDGSGHVGSGTRHIVVVDTTGPTLTLPGPITVDATTPAGAVVSFTATATDFSGASSVTCSPQSGSTFPVGTTTVNCSAVDMPGNPSSGSFTVTVRSVGAPNGQACSAANACLSGFCVDGVCCASACGGGDAADCQACSVAAGGTANGTCTPVVAAHVCRASGGVCDVAETCNGTSLACPADGKAAAGTLCRSANGVCDVAESCDGSSAACPTDAFKVAGTVCQAAPNVCTTAGTCSGTGTTCSTPAPKPNCGPPIVTVPANMTVEATCAAGAKVTFTATAKSVAGATLPVTCTPASGTTFALGAKTVKCTATDPSSSLVGAASFTVTVSDTKGPVFSGVPGTIKAFATSTSGAKVTYTNPKATDAVDGASNVTCTPASGSQFALKTTTVKCTAPDKHGNTSPATFSVSVTYEAPTDGTFFLIPLRSNGASIFRIGRPVPVRFKLTGASAGITNLTAKLTVAKISNTVQGTVVDERRDGRRRRLRLQVPPAAEVLRLPLEDHRPDAGHLPAQRRPRRRRHPPDQGLAQAMKAANDVTAPAGSPIDRYLVELHARYRALDEGTVATYIPELAKANPSWFGICVATPDGHVYEVGDTAQAFTIQSISKPFAYGLALEDRGRPAVLDKIGVEPTGDAFNSISLQPGTGRPLNPMINAGAIATTSLVAGATSEEKVQRLVAALSVYAGRPLTIAEAVYLSEKETGHRNRAIGHMLRNFDIITEEPTPALDAYFQQCSIDVTCRDLAVMAATLANGGVNPTTGERALKGELVDSVLSVMMSCGMYDYAGEWLYLVGAPAKSGVSGGIMAVWPGHLGIAVFSPRLDARGNSVRGIRVCQDLSRELNLHSLRVPSLARNTVRGVFDLSRLRSKRVRRAQERRLLDEHGGRAKVYQLQGDLMFAAAEAALHRIRAESAGFDLAVVDLRRVSRVDAASAKLLASLLAGLREQGKRIVLCDLRRHRELERFLSEGALPPRTAPDLDGALELCENDLIASRSSVVEGDSAVPLSKHDLLRGLSPDDFAAVKALLRAQSFRRGDVLVRQGEAADDIFLLTEGQVSVVLELPGGQARRLATLSAGMTLGELSMINGTPRTADVRADTAVECQVLSRQAWVQLAETHAPARLTMLENVLRHVSGIAAALTAEVAALEEG